MKERPDLTCVIPECKPSVLGGNISADLGLTLKKKLLKIRDVRKWVELPWEESNSLAPDVFR